MFVLLSKKKKRINKKCPKIKAKGFFLPNQSLVFFHSVDTLIHTPNEPNKKNKLYISTHYSTLLSDFSFTYTAVSSNVFLKARIEFLPAMTAVVK